MAAATKEQILDTTEELLAEQGIDGVSLRAITQAAAVNLASVHYHFGSKEALVKAVFVRRIAAVNRERIILLNAAESEAGDGALTVDRILYAIFAPAIQLSQDPQRGRRFMRLCGRFYAEPADYLETVFKEEFAELVQRMDRAFKRAAPHLAEKELRWRIHFAVGAMVHTMMDSDRIRRWTQGFCDPTHVEETIDAMVRFTSAGMNAPASNSAGGGVR